MLATRSQALELSIVFSQSWARRRHRRAGQPADITQLLFGRALSLRRSNQQRRCREPTLGPRAPLHGPTHSRRTRRALGEEIGLAWIRGQQFDLCQPVRKSIRRWARPSAPAELAAVIA